MKIKKVFLRAKETTEERNKERKTERKRGKCKILKTD
jgi:hypothetical protein